MTETQFKPMLYSTVALFVILFSLFFYSFHQPTSKKPDSNAKSTTISMDSIGHFNDPTVQIHSTSTALQSNIQYMGFDSDSHLSRFDVGEQDKSGAFLMNVTKGRTQNSILVFLGMDKPDLGYIWTSSIVYASTASHDLNVTESHSRQDGDNYSPFIALPSDLSVGKKWSYTKSSGVNEEVSNAEVIGVADVTVPAGTYHNCLAVQTMVTYPHSSAQNVTHIVTDFYAPSIGLVKTDVTEYGTTRTQYALRSIGSTLSMN